MKKYIIAISILIILLILFLLISNKKENTDNFMQDNQLNKISIDGISKNGNIINISKVNLLTPGFIVAKEVINDKPGQIVEISDFLPAGESTDINIQLPKDQIINAVSVAQNGFPTKVELILIAYSDDGDKLFNSSLDKPALNYDSSLYARYVDSGLSVPKASIMQDDPLNESKGADIEIVYTPEGFNPSTINIKQGQTVQFTNKSGRPMWVASNVHPGHNDLPTFDQFKATGQNSVYKYTFDKPGIWKYHDHVNASMGGVVIVE